MNPSTRRYLPVVAIVALLLVAVYFGQPDRMTGSAAGAGCAGGQGQLATENELGVVEKDALDSVRAVANFDTSLYEAGEIASLEDLKANVEEFGASALPALLEEINSSQCMSASSAELIDLVQIIGEQEDFDNMIRTVVSKSLLQAAVYALDTAGSDDSEGEMQAETHTAGVGDNKPAPEVQISEAGQKSSAACAERSLELVQGWAASSESDLDEMIAKVEEVLGSLEESDPSAIELVALLDELTSEDETWAKSFEKLATDQSVHKDARGLACEAAVARGSVLSSLREDVASITSPAVSVCLIESSVEWEDSVQFAAWGLKNQEESVRLAAITAYAEVGGSDDILGLLSHLFAENSSAEIGISVTDSERTATVATIAALVQAADAAASELLADAAGLAGALGGEGDEWFAALDQAIPAWDPAADAKD